MFSGNVYRGLASEVSHTLKKSADSFKKWTEDNPKTVKAIKYTAVAAALLAVALLAMHFGLAGGISGGLSAAGHQLSNAGHKIGDLASKTGHKMSDLASRAWTNFTALISKTHTMSAADITKKLALPTTGVLGATTLLLLKGKEMREAAAAKLHQLAKSVKRQPQSDGKTDGDGSDSADKNPFLEGSRKSSY